MKRRGSTPRARHACIVPGASQTRSHFHLEALTFELGLGLPGDEVRLLEVVVVGASRERVALRRFEFDHESLMVDRPQHVVDHHPDRNAPDVVPVRSRHHQGARRRHARQVEVAHVAASWVKLPHRSTPCRSGIPGDRVCAVELSDRPRLRGSDPVPNRRPVERIEPSVRCGHRGEAEVVGDEVVCGLVDADDHLT